MRPTGTKRQVPTFPNDRKAGCRGALLFATIYIASLFCSIPTGAAILHVFREKCVMRSEPRSYERKFCTKETFPTDGYGLDNDFRVKEWNSTTFMTDGTAPYQTYFLLRAPALQYVYLQHSTKVMQLFIEHCSLAGVPRTVRNLPALQLLIIRYCRLRHLQLGDLLHAQMLQSVDLSHNRITTIFAPGRIGVRPPTTHLFLSNNSLQQVSLGIFGALEDLVCLHLDRNQLDDVVADVPLRRLQELSVAYNRLTALDLSWWRFRSSLKIICANHNRLTSAPIGWRALTKLEELELSFNYIRSFRMDELYLSQVRKLNLASNVLTTVATAMLHLRVPLENLQLSHNQLSALDISRWGMPNLWEFSVTHNRLTELADAFTRFPNLSNGLDLRQNRWSCEWLGHIHPSDLESMRYGQLRTNESCPGRSHQISDQRWICCWDSVPQTADDSDIETGGHRCAHWVEPAAPRA